MFAIASFFALMRTASASATCVRAMSGSDMSAQPGSRSRRNHAFSAKRAMSMTNFLPCSRATRGDRTDVLERHGLAARPCCS